MDGTSVYSEGAGGRERGREGGEGRDKGSRRKFYLGAELIKCIDPNEGEALWRRSTFKPGGGGWRPLPPRFRRLWGGGREGDIAL